MERTNGTQKFKKYCSQLEKYGETEKIHSPVMAMLRRKARKQLIELMKEESDSTSNINKLWIVGYYHPFQFYIREEVNVMETTTLLTMFCGELQEMLLLTDNKYHSLWNMYIGDLHRYMPEGEIQKLATAGYYSRAIELDSKHGRAFHVLSSVRKNSNLFDTLRLLLLGQLAEIPYKKNSEFFNFLKLQRDDALAGKLENLTIEFVDWALCNTSKHAEHQIAGLKIINEFKSGLGECKNDDVPMMLSVCRLTENLVFKIDGYDKFGACYDVVSDLFLIAFSKVPISKSILSEAILWICDVGEIFESVNSLKNEPHFLSLSVFAKTKWSELNDIVMEHINRIFETESFEILQSSSIYTSFLVNGPTTEPTVELIGHLVDKLISMDRPTMKVNEDQNDDKPLLRRINLSIQKRLDIPLEIIAEKINQMSREDWRPVYVLMDFDTILEKIQIARKVWDIDDFICILPSSVLDKLDSQKTKIKAVRPAIRSLMELQAEGKIILKQCEDERHCAEQLVQSAKGSSEDHRHIVAFLCKNPENEKPMDGVTFYEIRKFYQKYLE
uniref:PINc domain-containing protein n=1 Tax=Caenorhabditis tropicalis TaxID=1561998 RepID=A0A1I7UL77_9PELO